MNYVRSVGNYRRTIRVSLASVAATFCLAASAAGSTGDTNLRSTTIGYYPGGLVSLPAFIANDKGFFRKNGIDAKLISIPNGPAMTAAVINGGILFANNSYDNLSIAASRGLPVKAVVGSMVKNPWSIVVAKGVPLPDLKEGYPDVVKKDLMDKKWGVVALGASGQFVAQEFVAGTGHSAGDVTYIAVGLPATARAALKSGAVDLYVAPEPLGSIVASTGEGTVVANLLKGQGPPLLLDLNYNGWWANKKTIDDDKDLVASFVKANEQAYCWYSDPKNIEEVIQIMKKYVPIPDLDDAKYSTMIKEYLPAHGVNITEKSINTWQDILIKNGLLKKRLPFADLIASTAQSNYTCPALASR